MKQRVLSIIVTLVLIISMLPATSIYAFAAQSEDDGYIGIVQKTIEEVKKSNWSDGCGALYDIDGNGIEELILVYSTNVMLPAGYEFPATVCSVYSMSDGELVQLIDREILFMMAGGSSGYVAVVEYEGNKYLAIVGEKTEHTPSRVIWSGTWKLHVIDGTTTKIHLTRELTSSKESEAWNRKIKEAFRVDPLDENSTTLDELLEYLKENPVGSEHETGNICENMARKEWVEQHMEYASSQEYETEIVGGFDNRMLAVFRDALDDEEIKSYNVRKALSAFLSVDVEFDDVDMYELIIAQILYGQDSRQLTEQAFEVNYQRTLRDISKSIVDIANSGDSIKELPKDVRESITELYELMQTLECGSEEYGKTLRTFFGQIGSNGKEIISKWKTELLNDVAFTGLGIAIEGAFEQYDAMEDIAIYISNYAAYQNTSRQTKAALDRLTVNVLHNYESWYGINEMVDELGVWNSAKNWPAFQVALKSIANAMQEYEHTGAVAIAEFAVEREKVAVEKFAAKTEKTIKVFAVEKALSCVPVINTILIAKNVINAGLVATIILDDIFEKMYDRAYMLDVLIKTYCISVMLDITVEDCAESMSEDDFYSTTVFDESVAMYKRNLLLASGYAVKYADTVLQKVQKELTEYDQKWHLFDEREQLVQSVMWYSNSMAILEEQQVEIEGIACHDPELYYDQFIDEVVYYFKDSRIHIVACPVDVIIRDDTGAQIAYLSGENDQVREGYEFYFHTIKAIDESGEYIKVAIVPDGWQIELKGTADGAMHVFTADFTTEKVDEVETYFNIPITKGSNGYVNATSNASEESKMMMDQRDYSNMESVKDIPTEPKNNTMWIWIVCGVALLGVTVIIVSAKRNKK